MRSTLLNTSGHLDQLYIVGCLLAACGQLFIKLYYVFEWFSIEQ